MTPLRQSQSPVELDSMQGWKQQHDRRQPHSARGHDPKNPRRVSEGFYARYQSFCDGAKCVEVEYIILRQLVYVESKGRAAKCTLHYCSSWRKDGVEEMERDSRH